MASFLKTCTAAALAVALAACGGTTYIGDDDGGHLSLHNGLLTAHAQGQPDATIDAAGDLRIGDKPVAVTPAQHDLIKAYYTQVLGVREAGIETGKAGARLAGRAVGAVVSGLAHGDPDSIGSKIDDRAQEVEEKALAICDNVEALQKAQDAVAASLPAFKPYATMEASKATDCRKRTRVNKR